MNIKLEEFFKEDEMAFYINKNEERRFRGVDYHIDTLRKDKAIEQAKQSTMPFSKVFSYVNEFLEMIRADNGYITRNIKCDFIELDNTKQMILDNGIIAKNLEWEENVYDKTLKKYIKWDKKYDDIKEKFKLEDARDIIWLKFTNKGHLGVVAKSFDINFKYNVSSGKLIKYINQEWDKSFVYIFPLNKDIIKKYKKEDIELGIGNYLIYKKVPIIDYYSHNN